MNDGYLRSLYLCYLPLSEPLVETQVRAYLRGLASAGHEIHLATWEVTRQDRAERARLRAVLAAEGIHWHRRRYHKRPSLLATAWDTLGGSVVASALVWRHRIDIVHVRTHIPGAMGLAARRLTGCGLLFDVRGLMAEEYVDAGTWAPGSLPYRLVKAVERRCLTGADGVVVLTERARILLFGDAQWTESGSPVAVIPSCVDATAVAALAGERPRIRQELGLDDGVPVLVYVGKFSTWYMAPEMARFVAAARRRTPSLRFLVLTQSDPALILDELDRAGVPPEVTIVTRAAPEDVGAFLAAADMAISFIRDSPSKIASSPTKVGEYLAAGLPIVVSAGVGDTDAQVEGAGVGVVVRHHTDEAYLDAFEALQRLAADPLTAARCTTVANEELSLEHVGLPSYRRLYHDVGARIAARRHKG